MRTDFTTDLRAITDWLDVHPELSGVGITISGASGVGLHARNEDDARLIIAAVNAPIEHFMDQDHCRVLRAEGLPWGRLDIYVPRYANGAEPVSPPELDWHDLLSPVTA